MIESCCGNVPVANAAVDLTLAFSTGLAMSIGHCVGMCGPLVSAFGAAQRTGGAGSARVLSLYHAGRLTSYAILGFLFGWLGEAAGLQSYGSRLGGGLSIVAGIFLLFFAAGILGWFPFQDWVERHVPWSRSVGCAWGRLLRSERDVDRFGIGFLNGWLPCGPVYALALLAAGTQRPEFGALVMFVYGLGTVPVLSLLSAGAARIPVRWRIRWQRLGTAFLLVLALQLVARGAAAGGWIAHLRFGDVVLY